MTVHILALSKVPGQKGEYCPTYFPCFGYMQQYVHHQETIDTTVLSPNVGVHMDFSRFILHYYLTCFSLQIKLSSNHDSKTYFISQKYSSQYHLQYQSHHFTLPTPLHPHSRSMSRMIFIDIGYHRSSCNIYLLCSFTNIYMFNPNFVGNRFPNFDLSAGFRSSAYYSHRRNGINKPILA
jgi:hypothetical protein